MNINCFVRKGGATGSSTSSNISKEDDNSYPYQIVVHLIENKNLTVSQAVRVQLEAQGLTIFEYSGKNNPQVVSVSQTWWYATNKQHSWSVITQISLHAKELKKFTKKKSDEILLEDKPKKKKKTEIKPPIEKSDHQQYFEWFAEHAKKSDLVKEALDGDKGLNTPRVLTDVLMTSDASGLNGHSSDDFVLLISAIEDPMREIKETTFDPGFVNPIFTSEPIQKKELLVGEEGDHARDQVEMLSSYSAKFIASMLKKMKDLGNLAIVFKPDIVDETLQTVLMLESQKHLNKDDHWNKDKFETHYQNTAYEVPSWYLETSKSVHLLYQNNWMDSREEGKKKDMNNSPKDAVWGRAFAISHHHFVTTMHNVTTPSNEMRDLVLDICDENYEGGSKKIHINNFTLIYPPLILKKKFMDIAIFESKEKVFSNYIQLFGDKRYKLLAPEEYKDRYLQTLWYYHKGIGIQPFSQMKIAHYMDWYVIYDGVRDTEDGDCGAPGLLSYNDVPYLFSIHRRGYIFHGKGQAKLGAGIRVDLWLELEFGKLMHTEMDLNEQKKQCRLDMHNLVLHLKELYKLKYPLWFCPEFQDFNAPILSAVKKIGEIDKITEDDDEIIEDDIE